LFNPVFWLLDSIHDLPPWLVVGGERNRAVSVALPDRDDRQRSAALLATDLAQSLTGDALQKAIDRFAIGSDGLTLKEMSAIAHIAADRDVSIDDIGDAIRYYKVGVTDNPWGSALVRQSIAQGEAAIGSHVIGQDAAVRQTLDILIRSVMGLHGAQVSSSSNRPRGVLFFAGPTGVGKTELAKSVSRLIFGHEDSCVRFDMSEFSAEHSEARLIGAPPGYIGHDAGGELVNAIRQRPFSVLLFDEIEKAHPRILDKFLQILEDGRLTDGRGDTVYFSESILIFTSNLGIVRKRGDGRDPEILVRRGDDPEAVRTTIRAEISRHFREELSRPELLNRIGENVVVFDFITDEVAAQIFAKLVRNVSERVLRMLDLRIEFGPGVYDRLFEICRANLDDGGRGIGNMIEVALVNPLARELFAMETRGPIVTISDILHEGGKYSVRLE
jgi:ATP-dependent Clp protease ATP-binding subunit ClpA